MKKRIALGIAGLLMASVLASCSGNTSTTTTKASGTTTSASVTTSGSASTTTSSTAGGSLTFETEVADGYTYDAASNSYIISVAGEYSVSGTLTNGSITCSADLTEKVTLNLEGVSITTNTAAIVWSSESSKIEIKAKKGYVNTLTTTAATTEHSTIESENNVEIGGKGTLNIINNQHHGIDASEITIGGEVILNITANEKDGVHGKSVLIDGGTTTIKASGDAIQAKLNSKGNKGTFEMTAGSLYVNNSDTAIKADTSVTFSGTDPITFALTSVETAIDCTTITNTSSSLTYTIDGVTKTI